MWTVVRLQFHYTSCLSTCSSFIYNIDMHNIHINIFLQIIHSLGLCWRASVASETLTGVTQLKIGDVCLLASERSERDSIRGG